MTGMKYIVVDDGGFELPELFHQVVQHTTAARGRKVVGAGFFDGTHAGGESVGLGIKSRPVDTEIIRSALRTSL